MPEARVNGVRLHYELEGEGPAALVLVHGSWSDRHAWDAVVPGFARSFRVLTYDRRGHSDSERAEGGGPGSIEEDALDLAGLIGHLHLAPAHIVGSSFGASIALKLAVKGPRLFATLTAHEPPLIGLIDGHAVGTGVRESLMAVASRLQQGDLEGGARQFVEDVAFGPGTWDTLSDASRRKFMLNAPTFLDEFGEPEAFTLNVSALAGFDRPALLTEGDQSHPFFRPILDQIAGALPSARRHTFTGAGHAPHITHPGRFVRAIGDFVGQCG